MMEPRFETVSSKTLIGKQITMSFANNRTGELWKSFMPRRREITGTVDTNLYSLQVYGASHFTNFNPETEFVKWAAVEVANDTPPPADMESFALKEGLYAVFLHKGSSRDTSTHQYIYTQWLPQSEYELDNRPHFEILGEKYKNDDPDSEEEIWIPVKRK